MPSEKPSDNPAFSDPGGPKFKIAGGAPRTAPPLSDEEARRWLEQPVTPRSAPRTIKPEGVPSA